MEGHLSEEEEEERYKIGGDRVSEKEETKGNGWRRRRGALMEL